MRWINGTRLDDRIIRCDWDCGFIGALFEKKLFLTIISQRDANMDEEKQAVKCATSTAPIMIRAAEAMASVMGMFRVNGKFSWLL